MSTLECTLSACDALEPFAVALGKPKIWWFRVVSASWWKIISEVSGCVLRCVCVSDLANQNGKRKAVKGMVTRSHSGDVGGTHWDLTAVRTLVYVVSWVLRRAQDVLTQSSKEHQFCGLRRFPCSDGLPWLVVILQGNQDCTKGSWKPGFFVVQFVFLGIQPDRVPTRFFGDEDEKQDLWK